jgi:hypothetical protein
MNAFLLLVLFASPPLEQPPSPTMPFAAAHPATGEPGTWIPDWLRLRHIEDDLALKQCHLELESLDHELTLREDHEQLLEQSLALERKAVEQLEKMPSDAAQKLERRTRALWALVGVAAVSLGATVVLAL